MGGRVVSTYTATIRWTRDPSTDFTKGQYSRAHDWVFDGGAVVPASPSPHVVPGPWSDKAGVDPEEAFVASLSSCHMLFFVDFARRAGFVIDSYLDEAEGLLEKRVDGKMAMTRVTLRPHVTWDGEAPDGPAIADLHHRAHEACFIANSVMTEVVVESL
jgi:organic hydroperoxide reductase OsmC/OhrA